MKYKKAYLQRLIYQMGDLCNDPDQFNDDAYNELLHTVASIDVLALLRPLEKLLQSYERTEDRYFCYLLQRHILLNSKKYIQLAALQYHAPPKHIAETASYLHKPLLEKEEDHWRRVPSLITLTRHEDPFIRVWAITSLSYINDYKAHRYFAEYLLDAPSMVDIQFILSYFINHPTHLAVRPMLQLLQHMEHIQSLPVKEQVHLVDASVAAGNNCGIDALLIIKHIHQAWKDIIGTILFALSRQHEHPEVLAVAKRYINRKKYREAAFLCLLYHTPEERLVDFIKLFQRLMNRGYFKRDYLFPQPEPVVSAFSYLRRYVMRHPEVQQLYRSYTHERSHLLTDLQLEQLLTLRPEFETYSPN